MDDPFFSFRPRRPDYRGEPIHVDRLCFDLTNFEVRQGLPADWLVAWAQEDISPTEALRRYLDAVMPSGLPCTLLVSNAGDEAGAAEHLRTLLFRPRAVGPLSQRFALGGQALALVAFRRQGRLVPRNLELTPHVLRRDFEAEVSGVAFWGDEDLYMSLEDFARLGVLPFHRAQTRERLSLWRQYLDWKERLVRKQQLSVNYRAFRWESDERIAFLVEGDAELLTRLRPRLEMIASAAPPDPEDPEAPPPARGPRQRPDVDLGEIDAIHAINLRHGPDREGWGDVRPAEGDRRVVFRLDEDVAQTLERDSLAARGVLSSSIVGELATINNQRAGLQRLQNGQGFCPRLADFIFDARGAGVAPEEPGELPPVRSGRALNDGQQQAVRRALSAPDLCLIQGPPGTGKTTVIADLCLRAVAAGQRVLVASQTNLAVDNALARLADTPLVRRLRLGNPGKVDEEFKDFLAENVISRWFSTIADQCHGRLEDGERGEADHARRVALLRALEGRSDEHAEQSRLLAQDNAKLEQTRLRTAAARAGVEAASNELSALERLIAAQRAVLSWVDGEDTLPQSPPPAEDILDPQRLRTIDAALRRRAPLEALREALRAARAAGGSEASPDLRRLRAEKQQLLDAEDEAGLLRLGDLNRQIRQLEVSGWSRATGQLSRAAEAVFGATIPEALARAADALRPDPGLLAGLSEMDELVARQLVEADTAEARRLELRAPATSALERAAQRLSAARAALDQAGAALEQARAQEETCLGWCRRRAAARAELESRWDADWRALWEDDPPPPGAEALALATSRIGEENAEVRGRLSRARRWRGVQQEWLARLANISDSDREQLQALYVRAANVVGMTTNEAGKKSTWQHADFVPFDLVIVDEVSKATPPELILPMLLGRRVVLVGDHRQLPPMFRERDASFGEALADGEISEADFERFRKMVTASLFEELFEQAPQAIKATLWMQYRMHPQIMDVVNVFYDGRLEAGPDRETLALRRPHHIQIRDRQGGLLLEPQQHLLWVDSSRGPDDRPCFETQAGSGKQNDLEVRLVVEFLVRLGTGLVARGYTGDLEASLDARVEGRPLRDALIELLPRLPTQTLDELFEERRVRIEGRAQPPERPARAGQTVTLHARREVGVLTFYGAQLRAIRAAFDAAKRERPAPFAGLELRTNTVDRFQGMEKPIIVASLVRSKPGRLGDFVREYQRVNVGLSRAQQLLVIVGAAETWKNASVPLPPIDGGPPEDRPVYAHILDHARVSGGRRVVRQLLA